MSSKKPSLMNVLSETSGVITAHSRHFLTLSILFIFPNTIAAIIYSFFIQPPSLHHLRFLSGESPPYSGTAAQSQLPYQIVTLFLSTFLFNFCTVPSITYSTFNGFYGKPVELIASLKSILVSFLPLLATSLLVQTITSLIIFCFVVLVLVSNNGLSLLGLEMDYNESYILVIAPLVIGLLLFLQVEWYLVNAVVVLESKWGFAPLKRSCYLVKGMRGVIFLVAMLFGVVSALSVWFLGMVVNAHRINEGSMAWLLLQVVLYFGVSVVLSLYGLAANTVIFVHCKALHQESEFQTDDQLGAVYVQLPSHVV